MLEVEHELVAVQLRLAADAGELLRACDGGPRIGGASTAREDGERDDDCRSGDAGGRDRAGPPRRVRVCCGTAPARARRRSGRRDRRKEPARDPGLDRSNRRSVLPESAAAERPSGPGRRRTSRLRRKGRRAPSPRAGCDRRRSSGLRLEGIRGCERTQTLEREPEPTLDSPEGHAEPDGDLGLRQPFEVGERDRLELVRR